MTRLPALLGPDLASKATAIAGYYLFDMGGSFTDVVEAAVGIDIPSMLASFNATRDNEIAVRLMLPWLLRTALRNLRFVVSAHTCSTSWQPALCMALAVASSPALTVWTIM